MKLKSKIWICILAVLYMFMKMSFTVNAEEDVLSLYAKSAVLMDADSFRVLYSVNADEKMAMASTTKIMTLLVTLENADLNSVVTISDYAASMPDVQLNCRSGEQYYLKDLVYSMMLESHNDSAVAIAEHVGGSVEGFAKMMNEKAREIGCRNTWFITPNGLDASEVIMTQNGEEEVTHGTTAKELACIMSYCITKSEVKDTFLEITRTPGHTFTDLSGKRIFSCTNHNALLTMLSDAVSGKTGYTGKAGYCYVGAAKKDGKTLVVALLACGWPNHKTYKWKDTLKLMDYGFENYGKFDLNQIEIPKEYLDAVTVTDFDNRKSTVKIRQEKQEDEILMRQDEKIILKCQRIRQISAPVQKGEIVGTIGYYCGDECVKELTLELGEDIKKAGFWDIYQKIAEYWKL